MVPEAFQKRMRELLGEKYEEFFSSYKKPGFRGIRFNPLKCGEETLAAGLPFPLIPAPCSPLSYYIPFDARVGALPLHHAGAFYAQEPSAASAVTILAPVPGERVLDLCAAPGGKSTQIASLLNGRGLLWSNEVVRGRANILLSNIERMGVRNAVVSSCHPETLCAALEGFFDKVLVDAPCSGEGMFRREEQAAADWSPEHVAACAARQRAILNSAAKALREGGVLVYSTCTFAPQENEGTVQLFLQEHPEFTLEDSGVSFGRPGLLPQTRRIYPMDGGEGHFAARLKKRGDAPAAPALYPYRPAGKQAVEFLQRIYRETPEGVLEENGKNLLLLPLGLPALRGLGVLRAGVLAGENMGNRIEPAHALFMAARPAQLCHVLDFPHDSPQIQAFLRGEELDAAGEEKGFCGVAVDGVLTGFGKCAGGRLKNRYPKGLRQY